VGSIMRKLSLSAVRFTHLTGWARKSTPAALGLTLAVATAATASAAPPPVGALTALAGQAACVTAVGGNAACAQARGVDGASSAVVSPDGRNLYLASYAISSQEGLAVFSRDAATGAVTQLPGSSGCLTADGSSALGPATCGSVRGFGVGDGRDLVFTSDGQWTYLVNQHARSSDPQAAIVLLRRDPATGALSQVPGSAGCISTDGSSQDGPGTCQTLSTLGRPFGISISPDDAFVYVTDQAVPARIHVLARDPETGALSEVQCLSEAPAPAGCSAGRVLGESKSVVLSPDGRRAYSSDLHGISAFDRNLVTGILTQEPGTAGCITDTGNDDTGASTCAVGRALNGTNALTISPDGATVYGAATTDRGVSVFHVADDGSLTQVPGSEGCITLSGSDGVGGVSCATGRALSFPFGIAISPDGRSLYVIADLNQPSDGVAIFSVDPTTGAATQLPGPAGCITGDGTSAGVAGACADGGPGLVGIYDPTISPNGAEVYLPGYDGQTLGIYRRETEPTAIAIAPPADQPPAGQPPAGHEPGRSGRPRVTPPPVLTRLRESAATWREVRSKPRRPVTTFSFTLSEPAQVTLTFTRQVLGRRVRGACVTPRPAIGHAPRCLRTVTLGAVALQGHAGHNSAGFSGHLPALGWLPRGRITVTAVATAARHHSAARDLSFVIRR
jgi:sugar lactone lactonase YvrE